MMGRFLRGMLGAETHSTTKLGCSVGRRTPVEQINNRQLLENLEIELNTIYIVGYVAPLMWGMKWFMTERVAKLESTFDIPLLNKDDPVLRYTMQARMPEGFKFLEISNMLLQSHDLIHEWARRGVKNIDLSKSVA